MAEDEAYLGAEAIRRAWLRGLAPDPVLTVSEWSDRFRYLSSRAASEPGLYRTDRTPYMRAIMDALSPSNPASRVVFMKSAQVGATEVGNNWIGFCVHRVPAPFLAVQPTVDMAKRLSQQRLDPLFEDSPVLRELITPNRTRDSGNTILSKRFKGGVLILTGANSAVGLRSMPARFVFLDEVDAYPEGVDEEGDPIALAEARTITFGHRKKLFLASTPTIKGRSRIEKEYEASDQQRYFVPCPHCGGLQHLEFERLRWDRGRPETVAYICTHCEERIEERHKTSFLSEANGACWMATAPEDRVDEARRRGLVGYHINGLYSPLGWMSWVDMARGWELAQGDDAALQVFKNTKLGETWQLKGEAPEWERLYERREQFPIGQVPGRGLILTAGVDVQRDRIEASIWAWGRGLESWLVEHIVLYGKPGEAEVWEKLTEVLGRTWPHESGVQMTLARLCIDTGDGEFTNEVYAWCRASGVGQVSAVKGVGGFDRNTPVDGPTKVDVSIAGKKLRRGVNLWKVTGAVFKSETYRWARLNAPTDEEMEEGGRHPPGFIHLPLGTTAEWVKQLTAEQLMTIKDRKGFSKLEWHKVRDRNEALDCRVYARAATWILGMDRWDDARWASLEGQLRLPESENAKPKPAGRPVVAAAKRRRSYASNYVG
ncbi:MAG TPA: phage terminase large subunit family protein [Novosphingobium sp.]|jgi:phage terminase large subunit GpA-like protein|nr:phage terminase large subunit family protein [Novosphingobium sp.]